MASLSIVGEEGIWHVISNFGTASRTFPRVVTRTVEGEGAARCAH
jgi:hypothetical protein